MADDLPDAPWASSSSDSLPDAPWAIPAKQNIEKPKVAAWGDVPLQAIKNLPSSAMQFGHDLIQPIIHPVDTAVAIKDIGHGALQKLGWVSGEEHVPQAEAVGKFLVDRYGSADAIKNTLANDPVGIAADLSTILSGGAGLGARAPGIAGRAAEIAGTAARAIDPLSAAASTVKAVGSGAARVIGDLGTHTGPDAIRLAAKAGYEGGEASKAFTENMRSAAPMSEAVDDARKAVGALREERGAAYRSGMVDIAKNPTILDFDKVDRALADISEVKTYKGQIISSKTQDVRYEIGTAIKEWKDLDPAEFHTAEGLDALKQKIGEIRDGTQYGTPQRVIADRAYHAIRRTIIAEDPKYGKIMKGYEEASETIREIERTLSLNPNTSVDTALRKLQSVLRNNVNTNYGQRAVLADFLVNAGAPRLMHKLAGQALSSWTPRGFGKLVAAEVAALTGIGAASGQGLAGLGVLPFMSPRFMGETAHLTGQAARVLPIRSGIRSTFQSGRAEEQQRPFAEGGGVDDVDESAEAQAAREIAAARLAQQARPAGGRKEGPFSHVLNNVAPHVAQGVADLVAAPGRLARGATPEVPGQWSEEDQFRADRRLQDAANWAPATAAAMIAPKPMPSGSLGSFAGVKAKNANLEKLRMAEHMDARGFPREQIWDETGWFQGPDKKWRFEIPDINSAHYVGDAPRVGNKLKHDSLYEAYPDIKDIKLDYRMPKGNAVYFKSRHGPIPEEIGLPRDYTPSGEEKELLLHELQHAIQNREGFATGAPPSKQLLSMKLYNELEKEGFKGDKYYEAYRRLAGETEARNVSKRAWTPEAKLKKIYPWSSEDVPSHLQAVRFKPGGAVSLRRKLQNKVYP